MFRPARSAHLARIRAGTQHGVAVDKRDIKCENIRAVGDVEIEVRLYKDISAKMVVHVEAAAVK